MNKTTGINLSKYFVTRIASLNGQHKVHRDGCDLLADKRSCIDLGIHMHGKSAMVKARFFYQRAYGCRCCSKQNHLS